MATSRFGSTTAFFCQERYVEEDSVNSKTPSPFKND
jgi:hypothetical protein